VAVGVHRKRHRGMAEPREAPPSYAEPTGQILFGRFISLSGSLRRVDR
jgi:hypothetical protein